MSEVASEMKNLDIGIVPYPSDHHMETYASPMKVFEYAAAGVVIIASNIKSHLDLSELELGIKYFEKDNLILTLTEMKHKKDVIAPINIPLAGLTKPAAGVIPTKPATAPVAIPTAVAFPSLNVSINAQATNPAAAET